MFIFYWKKWQLYLVLFIIAASLTALAVRGVTAVQVWQSQRPIYQGSGTKKWVSITVNVDWGEEYLPQMIEIFSKNKVKATFFVTGRWAREHPELTKKIATVGNEIGNHGYAHSHVNNLSLSENISEINKTKEIVHSLTKQNTRFYAPPYGEFNEIVLQASEQTKHRTILWTVDTIDWKKPLPEQINERVLKKAHNGAIILMHPTKVTVQALPVMIDSLKQKGYKIVPLEKLISE